MMSVPVDSLKVPPIGTQISIAPELTISADVNGGSRTVRAGETQIINPNVTAKLDSFENNGSIIVMGSLTSNKDSARFTNRGVILVMSGGSINYDSTGMPGSLANLNGGIIIVNAGASFALNLDNSGMFKHHGISRMEYVTILNNAGAELQNHGSLEFTASTFTNKGTIINVEDSSSLYLEHQGLISRNDGGQIVNYGQFFVGKSMTLENINGGKIFNNVRGTFSVGYIESGAGLINDATSEITNSGFFTASYLGGISNHGIFRNNYSGPGTGVLRTVPHGGDVYGTEGTYVNYGTLIGNSGSIIDNQGFFYREPGDHFDNSGMIVGKQIIDRREKKQG